MTNEYMPEPGTPETLGERHIGMEALYRLPNQAIVSQGTVSGLSPQGHYVRIGRHWLRNAPGTVLAVFTATNTRKRETPYE